jgi:hypothetical protein
LYPFAFAARPLTVTVVVFPKPVSKYPSIIRAFPGWSVIGSNHPLSDFQLTVAVVAAPVSSTSPIADELLAPLATFQLLLATTPATSLAPIVVPVPTKSMLMVFPVDPLPVVTVSVTVALCVSDPLLPVIVNVALPAGVLDVVFTVSVELFPGVIDVGLNVPVAPVGKPLTFRLTALLNPFSAPTLTV